VSAAGDRRDRVRGRERCRGATKSDRGGAGAGRPAGRAVARGQRAAVARPAACRAADAAPRAPRPAPRGARRGRQEAPGVWRQGAAPAPRRRRPPVCAAPALRAARLRRQPAAAARAPAPGPLRVRAARRPEHACRRRACRPAGGASSGVLQGKAVRDSRATQREGAPAAVPYLSSARLQLFAFALPPSRKPTSLSPRPQTVDTYFEKKHPWVLDGEKYVDKVRPGGQGAVAPRGQGAVRGARVQGSGGHPSEGRRSKWWLHIVARRPQPQAPPENWPPREAFQTPANPAVALHRDPEGEEEGLPDVGLQQARRVLEHSAHAAVARAARGGCTCRLGAGAGTGSWGCGGAGGTA
jgi:hypothetical protein